MPDLSVPRRRVLGVAGSFAVWLAASPMELLAASRGDVPDVAVRLAPKYRVLTSAQAAAFEAFAAQVIPSAPDAPGAREANITRFTDNGLAGFAKEQRADFAKALDVLDAESLRLVPRATDFVSLTASQQADVMRAVDKSNHAAFEALRAPVVTGMFANPSYGGNAGKSGRKLVGFDDRFHWQPPFGFHGQNREARHRD